MAILLRGHHEVIDQIIRAEIQTEPLQVPPLLDTTGCIWVAESFIAKPDAL